MRRLVSMAHSRRIAAGLTSSLLMIGLVVALDAAPALAAPPTTGAIPTPGLTANCPPPSDSVGSGISTISGVNFVGSSGECTLTQAHAAVGSSTFGANTILSADSRCSVDGVPTSVAIYNGMTITATTSITTADGYTLFFNVPATSGGASGRIAVVIVGHGATVNVAETLCAGAAYPILVAPLQQSSAQSASLGNAQNAGLVQNGSSGGSHGISSLLILLLAVGGLVIVNVAAVRTFRHRDHA
jgi:hypothetical protein